MSDVRCTHVQDAPRMARAMAQQRQASGLYSATPPVAAVTWRDPIAFWRIVR